MFENQLGFCTCRAFVISWNHLIYFFVCDIKLDCKRRDCKFTKSQILFTEPILESQAL